MIFKKIKLWFKRINLISFHKGVDMEEIVISSEEAKEKYGITSEHSKMPNGELRFRLKKDDGTAYIRTESSLKSGWQNSHYHNRVKETYIVQKGWIGYVELIDEVMCFKTYTKGQIFTTRQGIIHDIYMTRNAVIYTVKHGDSKGEQRLEDGTEEFTQKTKSISEKELKKIAKKAIAIPFETNPNNNLGRSTEEYSESYRHFDNLIWQVPAWSSGIFTAVLLGTINFKEENILISTTRLPSGTLLSLIYGIMGIFIFFLSYTLFRFRWHQIRVKNYSPRNHFKSPQVWLQFVINAQFIIFLLLSFSLIDSFLWLKLGIAFILLGAVMAYEEIVLFKKDKSRNRKESKSRS